MAIDDNTVYGLYGSQIKDLAGKIEEKQDELIAGEGISITDESGALVISSTGGSGPTVVQTTGTSTTDVMSQNAVSSALFNDPATCAQVKIGSSSVSNSVSSVAVGASSKATDSTSVAIGYDSSASGFRSLAIGSYSSASQPMSVAVGPNSKATLQGQFDISTGAYTTGGYNSSNYRLLTGLYDGQSDHDAVNLGQLNGRVKQNAGAPTTATVGTVGQLLEDTTNGKLYICTDATNPYVWEEVGAGGGGAGIIELTNADYNYPTDNPTSIALWMLDDGIYEIKTSIATYANTTAGVGRGAYIITTDSTNGNKQIVRFYANNDIVYVTNASTGAEVSQTPLTTPVVQITGTSTTDVMSQKATTQMVYSDTNGTDKNRIRIGNGAISAPPSGTSAIAIGPQSNVSNYYGVAIGPAAKVHSTSGGYGISIGYSADTSGSNAIAIGARDSVFGRETSASGDNAIAIGKNAKAMHGNSIALGDSSATSAQGEMNIGSTMNGGYNNSAYRLLTGLYDGQSAHDAVTKGQLDSAVSTLGTELDAKQDVLTAGQNITIAEESGALVISATGGSGADVFTTNEWDALWA